MIGMRRVLVQPCGNKGGRKHYIDTIESQIKIDDIKDLIPQNTYNDLTVIYPNGECPIWGVTTSGNNLTKYNKISTGDVALFSREGHIIKSSVVTIKCINKELAAFLWGFDDRGLTWENIYFLTNLKDEKIPYIDFNRAVGYKENAIIMGFNVLDAEKSSSAIELLGMVDFPQYNFSTDDGSQEKSNGIPPPKYGSGGESERHKNLKVFIRDNPEIIEIENVVNRKDERYYPTGDHVDVWFEDSNGCKYVVEIELEGDENLLIGAKQLIKYRALEAVEEGWDVNDRRVKAFLVAYDYDGVKTNSFCGKYDIVIWQVDESVVKKYSREIQKKSDS